MPQDRRIQLLYSVGKPCPSVGEAHLHPLHGDPPGVAGQLECSEDCRCNLVSEICHNKQPGWLYPPGKNGRSSKEIMYCSIAVELVDRFGRWKRWWSMNDGFEYCYIHYINDHLVRYGHTRHKDRVTSFSGLVWPGHDFSGGFRNFLLFLNHFRPALRDMAQPIGIESTPVSTLCITTILKP